MAPGGGKLALTLRARRGIRERYVAWGATHRDPRRALLWMHAPSVGEGLQARPVLERVRAERPAVQLAYTHFSPSATRFAASLDVDFTDYLPFDTASDVRAALDALLPTALVFAKLDVWPTLVREAARRGVRLGMISATLSDSSRRVGIAATLLRDAYARLDSVGAISAEDAERLVALGVRRDAIRVTGDTRYDQVWARARRHGRRIPLIESLRDASAGGPRPTLVAGSTWPADERCLLEAWRALRDAAAHGDAPLASARLIIAPHEPTPAHLLPIERWARGAGLTCARLGALEGSSGGAPEICSIDVVLVDRVGVLGDLYALADVAFVGGGFHTAGLHSVLEPAAFGTPVIFGPRHRGSRDAALLLAAGGAAAVRDATELRDRASLWLTDTGARDAAGRAARAIVEQGLGAAQRSYELVVRLLG